MVPSVGFRVAVIVLSLLSLSWAQVVEPRIATSRNSTVLLLDDASIWGFGRNADGEIGTGDRMLRDLPTAAADLSGYVDIAVGDFHTLLLRRDGVVLAVGRNHEGQLGDGTTDDRLVPVLVSGLPSIRAIGAGRDHSVAVSNTGEVWSWGGNRFGQLGRGSPGAGSRSETPAAVTGVSNATVVRCGRDFTHVLTNPAGSSAALFAFGLNVNGQLGITGGQNRETPVQVPGIIDPVAVACGESHVLVLQADGRVLACGVNSEGQLGLGDENNRASLTLVSTLAGIEAIGCGSYTSFAIDSQGQLWAMGSNIFGQLGVGDLSPNSSGRENLPRQATGVQPLFAIDGGALHSSALTRDGQVVTFGSDALGQLGMGSGISQQPLPQLLPNLIPGRPAAAVGPAEVPYGETLTWFLGGFPARPFALYVFDFSLTGSMPGITLPGLALNIPLNPPLVFSQAAGAVGPQRFTGFSGVLDQAGLGQASFDLPNDPGLSGRAINAALLLFDRVGMPELISPAERTTIVPPQPEIASLSPRSGSSAGGTTVTVRGTAFVAGMTVTFGQAAATSVTLIDANTLRCVAPAGMPGFVDVTVTGPAGRMSSLPSAFEFRLVDPIPTVTAVEPAIGPVAGGTVLTIRGQDFRPGALIDFGPNQVVATSVPNPQTLTCTLPAGQLGPVVLKVANPSSEAFELQDGFVYVGDLALNSVRPTAPQAGETVTLGGQGFLPGVRVLVNGVAVPLTTAGLRQVIFDMPASTGCDLTLTVENPGGLRVTRPLNPTPTVNIVIGNGGVRPGQSVVIFGTGFDERMTATVNGGPANLVFVASTQVVLTAPLAPAGSTQPVVLSGGSGCSVMTSLTYAP